MELTHSHLGLLTRHLGHLKPPRTFLTRHLFIDGHLLPSATPTFVFSLLFMKLQNFFGFDLADLEISFSMSPRSFRVIFLTLFVNLLNYLCLLSSLVSMYLRHARCFFFIYLTCCLAYWGAAPVASSRSDISAWYVRLFCLLQDFCKKLPIACVMGWGIRSQHLEHTITF